MSAAVHAGLMIVALIKQSTALLSSTGCSMAVTAKLISIAERLERCASKSIPDLEVLVYWTATIPQVSKGTVSVPYRLLGGKESLRTP